MEWKVAFVGAEEEAEYYLAVQREAR